MHNNTGRVTADAVASAPLIGTPAHTTAARPRWQRLAALGALALASMQAVAANNTVGAWSPVFPWPLIAVHTVLTPDSRVMSYGTDQAGLQTGYFVYDIWDASDRSHGQRARDPAEHDQHGHLLQLATGSATRRRHLRRRR